jgi:hypothetical protein
MFKRLSVVTTTKNYDQNYNNIYHQTEKHSFNINSATNSATMAHPSCKLGQFTFCSPIPLLSSLSAPFMRFLQISGHIS